MNKVFSIIIPEFLKNDKFVILILAYNSRIKGYPEYRVFRHDAPKEKVMEVVASLKKFYNHKDDSVTAHRYNLGILNDNFYQGVT